MLFWFIAALLTLGASLSVLLPLSRAPTLRSRDSDYDLEVYRDQLAELERDKARGIIQPHEAEQARAEIARRIIAVAGSPEVSKSPTRSGAARLAGALAVLAVPLISWGVYGSLGSPDIPSQPLAERLAKNPADSSVDELVARAEAHLAANPDDGRGWEILAPIYARLGRYNEAVTAYRNAIRVDGATAGRESGLGEAIAGAAGGLVSADARAAFERALALAPTDPKAQFYLATALAQEGKVPEAVAAWQAMVASLPQDSTWRGSAEEAIAVAQNQLSQQDNRPGPTQEQVTAAAGMSTADRNAMIETMVAGLDEKLRLNPKDPEGWARLVRSYVVLGDGDAARDALKRGIAALGPETDDAKSLVTLAAGLGLTVTD